MNANSTNFTVVKCKFKSTQLCENEQFFSNKRLSLPFGDTKSQLHPKSTVHFIPHEPRPPPPRPPPPLPPRPPPRPLPRPPPRPPPLPPAGNNICLPPPPLPRPRPLPLPPPLSKPPRPSGDASPTYNKSLPAVSLSSCKSPLPLKFNALSSFS
mmetsp:Transcript_27820/g.56913  ORF Transcript_27820/g.56913 Transcript_27820/m.56913 type:complete len:154 (+) Transcript_27820:79-540(+)